MWKYIQYLNVFVYCKFLKFLGHIMVLLVLSIIGFSWYAVVPATYGPLMVNSSPAKAFGAAVLVLTFSALVSDLGTSIDLAVLCKERCLLGLLVQISSLS